MKLITWCVCWRGPRGERCLCDFDTRDDAFTFAMLLVESGRADITVPVSIETEVDGARYEATKARILERIKDRVAALPAAYALLEVG